MVCALYHRVMPCTPKSLRFSWCEYVMMGPTRLDGVQLFENQARGLDTE